MNEELREEIIEDLGLLWCAVTNNFVHRDCFNHCYECPDFIKMENTMLLEFDEGDEPF